ncbi:putative dynein intermediate chain [Neospora caninum Liverpool]|uniref:Putative dynein intermediate chain n=1 Tax=Neospora caninum (strain Liverpool) TaxID=572307 RepID=F0VRR5_NEOCL|nr:putative dynein intermediate chain [Neospora caninum Liverpool]CBZ56413.1 putative dynein intermediate chain [Neospora caninum Liverpool]|eukprot:XP_003886438.1 putative dynein intermediate chain [Neospora caninum Liverpool]
MSSTEDVGAGMAPLAGEYGELLQEQQRELLRQRLADRQRELEARRQKLRLLQNEQNAALGLSGDVAGSAAIAGEVGKNVSSLMNEVMSSLQNLPKAATATGSGGEKGEASGTPAGAAGATAPLVGKKHRSTPGRNRGDRDSANLAFKVHRPQNVDTTIKPKTVESFDKSVQADLPLETEKEKPPVAAESDAPEATPAQVDAAAKHEPEKKDAEGATSAVEAGPKSQPHEETKALPKPVSEEERKRIMQSPEFEKFFERTTKVVERLLGQEELQGDPFVDYSGAQTNTDALGEKLQRVASYTVPKLTPDRPVLDVRASPHFPEVFLTSYGSAEFGEEGDLEGCVLLWSLAMRERPEYTFTCQSQVCSAIFNCFQPSVILGGTYAGGIVVWDTRAQSKPVQRTPLSSGGHAHPVYSMELVGTKNAHNLVSVDTDGRLCVWSLQMLGAPTETLDMKRGNKEVCIECIAFAENEVNSLVLGTEDGALLQANIHGNKPGVTEAHDSHNGAVTSLRFHPAAAEPGQRDYTGKLSSDYLLLSTSVDWTVKLWSAKRSFAKPLKTFDNYEVYIYDAAWHPTNPALFSCVDGEGHLDLWNLANDWETPAIRVGGTEPGAPPVAKNKVAWSSDGRRVVTGDAKGNVEVWAVANEFLQPRGEEAANFERQIEEAKPDNAPTNMDTANDVTMDFTE